MRNGGYKILDFKGVNITAEGTKIAGIYEAIEGNNKATLLTGVVINGTKYDDAFALLTVNGSAFEVTINGNKIVIDSEDLVKIGA